MRPKVTTQIFLGLVLGVVVGYLWPSFGVAIRPLADAFLRLIRMIVAPLLFSTLVTGIAGTHDLKSLGRIGLKAIVYFEVATTIALVIGLGLVNILQAGRRSGHSHRQRRHRRGRRRWPRISSTPGTSSCTSFRRRSSMRWPAATFCRSSCSRRSSAWRSPRSVSPAVLCSTCSRARRS